MHTWSVPGLSCPQKLQRGGSHLYICTCTCKFKSYSCISHLPQIPYSLTSLTAYSLTSSFLNMPLLRWISEKSVRRNYARCLVLRIAHRVTSILEFVCASFRACLQSESRGIVCQIMFAAVYLSIHLCIYAYKHVCTCVGVRLSRSLTAVVDIHTYVPHTYTHINLFFFERQQHVAISTHHSNVLLLLKLLLLHACILSSCQNPKKQVVCLNQYGKLAKRLAWTWHPDFF